MFAKNKISRYMSLMRRIYLTTYVFWGSVAMYYLQYQYFTRNREQQSDNFWKKRDLIHCRTYGKVWNIYICNIHI